MKQHVAIYVRVSSTSQKTASQEAELRRWATLNSPGAVWYIDTCTGKKMVRPSMDRMMAAVDAGQVSRIVIYRLDRLGRTAAGLVTLFEHLQELGVGLFSLKENIDLETPSGRLMCVVLAALAAFEVEVKHERQAAGIEAAKAKGKRWGGSKPGVRKKVSTTQVEAVLRLLDAGESIAAIARALSLSRPTVYSIIEKELESCPA